MEARALREDERSECIELWTTVWPCDSSAYFLRYFEGDVEWLPYYTQVSHEDGRIVSAVTICKRVVACGDFRLTMGGIANVATLPAYRNKGHSSACLKAAIAVMEADAIDFSLLFTGINTYYARHGFATLPWPRLRGVIGAIRKDLPPGITVRPAAATDFQGICDVYDSYNVTRPIAVQRSAAYWRDWIGFLTASSNAANSTLVAVNEMGRVIGYVVFKFNFYPGHQISEDYAYVCELGSFPEEASEVAFALLDAVAERARDSGKQEMHLSVALDSAVRNGFNAVCERTSENVTSAAMGRLLNRDGLLRSLLLEWNGRWMDAGRPAASVTFQTPYGSVCLDATGGFLKMVNIVEPWPRSRGMCQSTLAAMVGRPTGYSLILGGTVCKSPFEKRTKGNSNTSFGQKEQMVILEPETTSLSHTEQLP